MDEDPPMTATSIASSAPANAASDWRVWLDEYGPRLLLFARQQTRSHEDAEDILQEAIVKLVDKIQTNEFVGGIESWQAYLYTTIRRLAIDLSRREDRRRRREDIVTLDAEASAVFTDPWFESDLSDDETRSQLEFKLRELPEKFAEVIIMKIWGERTFAEIAETLGISQNTAASRYRYGLEALKKSLGSARRRGDLSI
jgi:RNA polymerase sigma-70 factor (ECF subfamily)